MITVQRQATWVLIGLVAVIEGAFLVAWSRLVFDPPVLAVLVPLHRATGGLVGANLVFGLIGLLLTVGFVIFGIGQVPPAAVGWIGRKAGVGLLVGLGIWVAMQVVLAAMAAVAGHTPALAPGWKGAGAVALAGSLLGQALGITLHEETVYRGFLFPQIAAQIRRSSDGRKLLVGALVSQLLFALSHLPNLALVQRSPALALDLLGLFLMGLGFVVCYTVTENLFVCIALHTLGNQPALLVPASDTTAHVVLAVLAILLLLAWRPATRMLQRRASAPATGEPAPAPVAR